MHELSIVMNLLEIAESAAKEAGFQQVISVHLRIGQFSGLVKEALELAFEIARENTLLAGATLIIEELPLIIYCPNCHVERESKSLQELKCPVCGKSSNDIRQGKEIEIAYLELADETEIT